MSAALTISIFSATGVQLASKGGLSDPYVECHVVGRPKQRFRTKPCHQTRVPEWDEEHRISDYRAGEAIRFLVWDADPSINSTFADDNFISSATLAPESFYPEGFFGELPLETEDGTASRLSVQIMAEELRAESVDSFREPGSPNARIMQEGTSDAPAARGGGGLAAGGLAARGGGRRATDAPTLEVRILAAHGLETSDGGPVSDPFVVARLGRVGHQTPIDESGPSPRWSDNNHFSYSVEAEDETLELEVMHYTLVDTLSIGVLHVDLRDLPPGHWVNRKDRLEGLSGVSLEFELLFDHNFSRGRAASHGSAQPPAQSPAQAAAAPAGAGGTPLSATPAGRRAGTPAGGTPAGATPAGATPAGATPAATLEASASSGSGRRGKSSRKSRSQARCASPPPVAAVKAPPAAPGGARPRAPLAAAGGGVARAGSPAPLTAATRLHVTMVGAEFPRGPQAISGLAAYCVCEVPGRPQSRLQTDAAAEGCAQPVWNHGYDFDYLPGETLVFTVLGKDRWPRPPVELGRAALPSEAFQPQGFEGDLALEEELAPRGARGGGGGARGAARGGRLRVWVLPAKGAAEADAGAGGWRLGEAPSLPSASQWPRPTPQPPRAAPRAAAATATRAWPLAGAPRPEPPWLQQYQLGHGGEALGGIKVSFLGARELSCVGHGSGSSTFSCRCEVRGRPVLGFETAAERGREPIWYCEQVISDYLPGEALEFMVLEHSDFPHVGGAHSSLVGQCVLTSEQFFPYGFYAETTLFKPGHGIRGLLRVKVVTLGENNGLSPLACHAPSRHEYVFSSRPQLLDWRSAGGSSVHSWAVPVPATGEATRYMRVREATVLGSHASQPKRAATLDRRPAPLVQREMHSRSMPSASSTGVPSSLALTRSGAPVAVIGSPSRPVLCARISPRRDGRSPPEPMSSRRATTPDRRLAPPLLQRDTSSSSRPSAPSTGVPPSLASTRSGAPVAVIGSPSRPALCARISPQRDGRSPPRPRSSRLDYAGIDGMPPSHLASRHSIGGVDLYPHEQLRLESNRLLTSTSRSSCRYVQPDAYIWDSDPPPAAGPPGPYVRQAPVQVAQVCVPAAPPAGVPHATSFSGLGMAPVQAAQVCVPAAPPDGVPHAASFGGLGTVAQVYAPATPPAGVQQTTSFGGFCLAPAQVAQACVPAAHPAGVPRMTSFGGLGMPATSFGSVGIAGMVPPAAFAGSFAALCPPPADVPTGLPGGVATPPLAAPGPLPGWGSSFDAGAQQQLHEAALERGRRLFFEHRHVLEGAV